LTQTRWAEAYLRNKWHLDPSSRLATIDTGRKLGAPLLFWGGGTGSPSNTMSLGLRPTSLPSGILIHPAIWPKQIWGENWGLCPFGGGGAGSPSSTMWPGPRPTCMPSGILIHPAIWPQQIWAENWGPLLGRRTGSPSNTMSLGLRPTSVPSGILIHQAIWPQ